jgi:alpha-tubulin suppressor-like RCC1 family protein
MLNVLFIDRDIKDGLVSSVNGNTLSIMYSSATTKKEVLSVLRQTFTTIERIGIAFVINPVNMFLDNQPFDEYSNLSFIIYIIKEFNVKNIDYLACNTLNYPEWNTYYKQLTTNTNVIVGASSDKTGNVKYGGNWIMESTCQDIEFIYFTKNIEYYRYLLDLNEGFFILIKSDNTLWGTGNNSHGQLGTGDNTNKTALTQMITGKIPLSTKCGANHTIVLMNDNTLWGTGDNFYGQLGTSDNSDKSVLTQMNTFGKIPIFISCGAYHTIVLMNDNTLWRTGFGSSVNSNVNVLTKIMIIGLRTPISVSCGKQHTIVLMDDNTLWGIDNNSFGQLGLGDIVNRSSLTKMNTFGKIPIFISGGLYHTIVLMDDHTLWGTGDNSFGQLGLGDIVNRSSLTKINTGVRTPISVSCGIQHTIVLMDDNTLWGTGDNSVGQLGKGDTIDTYVLTQMNTGLRIPSAVLCSAYNTFVLMSDNTLWSTGNNSGQFGTVGNTSLTNLGNEFKFMPGMGAVTKPSTVALNNLVDFTTYNHTEVRSALSANIMFEPNFTILTLPHVTNLFTGTYTGGISYSFLIDNYAFYSATYPTQLSTYTLIGIGTNPVTLSGTTHLFTNGVFANYTALIVTKYKIGGEWVNIVPGTLLSTLNSVFSTNNANKSLTSISTVDTLEGTEVQLALNLSSTSILKDYVSIVTNSDFPVSSITLNLSGFDITNNLTTYLGLVATPASTIETLTVYVTPAQMFSYFTDNLFNNTFLQDALAHNVLPDDIIHGVTGLNDIANAGKASFSTGCLDASGNNLIENLIMYISKKEINSDSAYAVMSPVAKQKVADQLATFGVLECNDFWKNTAVATQMINCFTSIGRTTLFPSTFVVGDVYNIYGKIATCSSQSDNAKTRLASVVIPDYTFTIFIKVVNVIPPTTRNIPSRPVYTSLNYNTVAPTGEYTFTTTFSTANTNTTATSYSYGQVK